MAVGAWTNPAEQGEGFSRWVRRARAAAVQTPARHIAVAGGKGGVGKSNFCLNVGLALADRGLGVRLVDCDAGLGSLDVLLGLSPRRHLGDVLGGCALAEVEVTGPCGLRLVPAPPEVWDSAWEAEAPGRLRAVLDGDADVVLFDAGAGLGAGVRALLASVGEVVVVTTPEPTALADAYATLKAVRLANRATKAGVVVNLTDGPQDGAAAFRALTSVCATYLTWSPAYLGAIPRDPAVGQAVRAQRPLWVQAPEAPATRAVRRIAAEFAGRGVER